MGYHMAVTEILEEDEFCVAQAQDQAVKARRIREEASRSRDELVEQVLIQALRDIALATKPQPLLVCSLFSSFVLLP